jgi:hypothetical protein
MTLLFFFNNESSTSGKHKDRNIHIFKKKERCASITLKEDVKDNETSVSLCIVLKN